MPRFPNGCGQKGALREGVWDMERLPKLAAGEWVVWHAACVAGVQEKASALTGLLTALQSSTAAAAQTQ